MVSRRMSVGTRLYVGFGLILAVLVVVTGIAVIKVERIDDALRANSEIHVQVQRYAINFRGSAHDRAIALRDVVLSTSDRERESHIAAIQALADFYAESAAPLERLITRPQADPLLGTLYNDIRAVEVRAADVTQAVISQVRSGAVVSAELLGEARALYVQWLASINALIDFKEARIQKTNQAAMEEAGSFLEVMLAALLVSMVLSGVAAWLVSRSIVRQLGVEPQDLAQVARQVAQGDLHPVNASGAGRHSVLKSLAEMQHSLAGVVGKVRQASNALTVSAHDISTGNAGLLQRTEEQSFSLQQVRDSVAQVAGSVRENADSAREAARLAASANQAARKGGAVMTEVVHTMEDITTSSREMADIVSLIDSIAFQTNILALNAAVEAARAGAGGRGFAVVAGEVRALAQRSAGAARDIKALIEQSVTKISRGAQLVSGAGATMTDIVKQADQVADLIAEISAATVTQTQSMAVVHDAVAHLDSATQENAAMVEQSAAAALELRRQAEELASAVSVFRLMYESAPDTPAVAQEHIVDVGFPALAWR